MLTVPLWRATLANGLRVLLATGWPTPRVAVSVHYGVGFRSEPPGREGFAHLFEHLMFQGSESLPDGFFYDHVVRLAGHAGGTTHQDYTDYFQSVPAAGLAQALFSEADRMRAPRFTEQGLARQLVGIEQEIHQAVTARPYGGFPWPLLPAVLYDGFANAHDGFGDLNRLRHTTIEACAEFFESHYAPANAVLTIVGDVDPVRTLELVEEHFGDIPARPVPPSPDLAEPGPARDRWERCTEPGVAATGVAWGYRLPNPATELDDYLAHAVLADLTSADGAVQTGCGFFGPLDARDPDALVVATRLPPEVDPAAVVTAVRQRWTDWSSAPRIADEVTSSVRALSVGHHRRHADLETRCRALGRLELLFGKAELVADLPSLLAAVTPERVAAAADSLGRAPTAVLVMEPGEARTRPAPVPAVSSPAPESGYESTRTRPAPVPESGLEETHTRLAPSSESGPTCTRPAPVPPSPKSEPEPGSGVTRTWPAPGASSRALESTSESTCVRPAAMPAPASRSRETRTQPAPAALSPAPESTCAQPTPVPAASSPAPESGPTRTRPAPVPDPSPASARRSAADLGCTPGGPRPAPPLGQRHASTVRPHQVTLPNGLRVVAVADHRAPLVELRLRAPVADAWHDVGGHAAPEGVPALLADLAARVSAAEMRAVRADLASVGDVFADLAAHSPRPAGPAPGASAGAVLVAVGDLDPEAFPALVAQHLSTWPETARSTVAPDHPLACAPEPPGGDDDARQLATMVLGGYYRSRLAELRRHSGSGGDVVVAREVLPIGRWTCVRATVHAPEVLTDVESARLALLADPPDQSEVDAAREYRDARRLARFDSPSSLADLVLDTVTADRDPAELADPPRVVSAAEVAAAATELWADRPFTPNPPTGRPPGSPAR